MSSRSPKTDPPPHERRWFVRSADAWRGYIVSDETGKEFVRVDRHGRNPIDVPFRKSEWIEDGMGWRPLTQHHVARVCQAADAALGMCTHDHARAKQHWEGLSQKERKRWREVGPPTDDQMRRGLCQAIREALSLYMMEMPRGH